MRLQRGIAGYQRGNYAAAVQDLRIAAFGLLDSPADYETALIYQLLASRRLTPADDVTTLVEKIRTVERIAPVYARLQLPADVRQEIDATLKNVPIRARPGPITTAPPPPAPAAPAPAASAPAPTEPLASQAWTHLQRGDEAGALSLANKALADDYTNALAHTVLAMLGLRHSDWPAVAEHYSVVRTRRRLSSEENSSYVMALARSGRNADAAGVERLLGIRPFVAKATNPAPQTAAPAPAPAPVLQPSAPPANSTANPAALLADADRALREGRILAARNAYLALAARSDLTRELALSVARGLNQTTAYRASSGVYQKLYPLHAGEEVHMFYEAVNRYEMGDYAIARKILTRALPALPRTRDVEMYRERIERTQ